MGQSSEPLTILMADDDEDDRLLAKDALTESRIRNRLECVENGVQLVDYLLGVGGYADREQYPLPGLILLDLNMPLMDGREALATIKSNQHLKRIPVVILTTSKLEEDLIRGYDLGAASYITKPVTFEGLVDMMKTLGRYWIEIVELPPGTPNA